MKLVCNHVLATSSRRLPEGGQSGEVGAEETPEALLRLQYTPKQGGESIPFSQGRLTLAAGCAGKLTNSVTGL